MKASTSDFALVHQHSEFRELLSQLIGNRAPLRNRSFLRVLSKHGVDQCEHHLALALPGYASAFLRKCTRQRCQVDFNTFATAALIPTWASEITSFTPRNQSGA
jgi:hypothetical protein